MSREETQGMASLGELPVYFQRLQEESLPSAGVEDPSIARIIAARLIIERLGETDANYWWDSQTLTEFGRARLAETVPRTTTFAQIDLATKVGRKVEQEAIEGDAVTLFDLGPDVEAEIERDLDTVDNEVDFDFLHELDIGIEDAGWTDGLVEGAESQERNNGGSLQIGEVPLDAMKDEPIRDDVVTELILGYGSSTKHELRVPYYRVKE